MSHTLPVTGEAAVSFGRNSHALVSSKDKPEIFLYYRMDATNQTISCVWEKPVPEGVHQFCYKSITASGQILMTWAGTLHCYDGDLQLVKQTPVQGQIVGSTDQHFIMDD